MKTYGINTKAYIDGFTGLVKCTVIAIKTPCNGVTIGKVGEITVRVDESKGGYTKGEVIDLIAAHTPPRKHVILKGVFRRINSQYEYKV